MAFRGRGRTRGGHSRKAYGGPQLPSVLRKQLAAQGDGTSGGATRGGTLNHRERRKLDKKEKLQRRQKNGTNKEPRQAPTPSSRPKQQAGGKSKGPKTSDSKKRKRAGEAPKTKFEELLALESKGGSSHAQADIEMEKRLAKKLKLKDGRAKGPQDGFDDLLGGLKDFGGQESDGQDSDAEDSDGQDSDTEEEHFEGSLGESESDDGFGFESDEESESELEETKLSKEKEQRTKQESKKGGVQKGGRNEEPQDGSDFDEASASEPSDGSQELGSEPSDGSEDLRSDEFDDEASAPSTSGREEEIETDIFGRPKRGGPAGSAAVKYVPPHLRAAEKGPLSEEMVRLQRRIRGLLNRLTEANVEPITNDMVVIFQTYARHSILEFIKEEILGALISGPRGNDQYAAVFAAFLAGLSALVGVEVGANFLGALMVSFEEQYRRRDSLACRNLALVLAHLYNFQLLSSPFIYEFLHYLCARFGELDVATIAHLLQTCGLALRTEDPVLMKDFVLAVQKRTAEENANFTPLLDEP